VREPAASLYLFFACWVNPSLSCRPIDCVSSISIDGWIGATSFVRGSDADDIFLSGSGANDRISGFHPSRDRQQFWVPAGQTSPTPGHSSSNGSTFVSWGGHSLEFLGLPDLSLSNLAILSATAVL
jgi:hypothetical protein